MSCQNYHQHKHFPMNQKAIWLGSLNIRVERSKKKLHQWFTKHKSKQLLPVIKNILQVKMLYHVKAKTMSSYHLKANFKNKWVRSFTSRWNKDWIYPPLWNNHQPNILKTVFKILDIKQQRTLIPERWKAKEVSLIIPLAHSLEKIVSMQWREG